ncbi:MAG: hypothetical protein ACI9JM_003356 [Halioglobus sp.]|jgi:hypothetical protein
MLFEASFIATVLLRFVVIFPIIELGERLPDIANKVMEK